MILPTLYPCSGNWGLERWPKVADKSMCRQGGCPLLHTARPKGVSTGDSRAGTSSVDETFLMMEGLLHLRRCAGRYGTTSSWRQNQRPSKEWLALSLSCFLLCSFLFISQTLQSPHPWPFPLEVPGMLTLGLVSLQVPWTIWLSPRPCQRSPPVPTPQTNQQGRHAQQGCQRRWNAAAQLGNFGSFTASCEKNFSLHLSRAPERFSAMGCPQGCPAPDCCRNTCLKLSSPTPISLQFSVELITSFPLISLFLAHFF